MAKFNSGTYAVRDTSDSNGKIMLYMAKKGEMKRLSKSAFEDHRKEKRKPGEMQRKETIG